MPTPEFIARNSRFFESLLEHRFLFDLGRVLVTEEPPRTLNILRAEVDRLGFDMVLSVDGTTRHVQMKTRSGKPPSNPYRISESLWSQATACIIWMQYDQDSLEPVSYFLLGPPLPPIVQYKRAGLGAYREVKMQDAAYCSMTIAQLARFLFTR